MSVLIIACSDGCVAPAVSTLQDQVGGAEAHRLIVPGGPLILTRPGMDRRVALSCVSELVEAHDVRTIYLVSHQECTAYERALGGFGFDQQELLERDLRRVRTLLETNLPGVDVHCFVIPWRENGGGASFGPALAVED